MSEQLIGEIRELVDRADDRFGGVGGSYFDVVRERLDSPLRIAVAGKVKAGKSTLLNALLGERLAPTDAAECTKLVTWYHHWHGPQVKMHTRSGRVADLSYRRKDGELHVQLNGVVNDDVHHVEVGWPTEQLRDLVLVDTPGLSSISTDISAASRQFLVGGRRAPGEADGVIYLMRCLHPADADFLEAFKDAQTVGGSSINAIGVVSRADEIGGARIGALDVADAVADRFQHHPELRRRCQLVIPVAGLLAQGSLQLDETDRRAFNAIASLSTDDRLRALRSPQLFVAHADIPMEAKARSALIDRYGIFGVRLATELLDRSEMTTDALRRELQSRSGLTRLRDALGRQFADRGRLLQARTALASVKAVALELIDQGGRQVLDDVSRVESRAHAFRELRALQLTRTEAMHPSLARRAERIVGANGQSTYDRMDVPTTTDADQLRGLIGVEKSFWAGQMAIASGSAREMVEIVMRSLDGELYRLDREIGRGA